MSELINNKEYKQQKLKELIMKLHNGATVDQVKEEFDKLTIGITATEITEMEQALVNEGMPVEDIQRLCDVHAAVFKGSIEDIHNEGSTSKNSFEKGHPVSIFKLENRAIEDLLETQLQNKVENYNEEKGREGLIQAVESLWEIDRHYKRKENLIFPYMEKYNITAPPQVMWGVDDEIRELIKQVLTNLKSNDKSVKIEDINLLITRIKEMIFKEEEIMFPMILDKFTEQEWADIQKSSDEIGYTLLNETDEWTPNYKNNIKSTSETNEVEASKLKDETVALDSGTKIMFDAGSLTSEEINSILNTIPIDMTFVGADNRVKYFTQGKERIFARPKTIIGREVKNCHPPKSVHIVEKIVEDLRTGKKDNEDFWIRMGNMFVYIRYFAVRNKKGEFLGTLEISQDIKSITELEGEKRLMS